VVSRGALHGVGRDRSLFEGALPSQLVRYQLAAAKAVTPAPVTPTTVAPTTTPTTTAPTPSYRSAAATMTPTTLAPTVTAATTPAAPVVTARGGEQGQATWYAAAPPGRCASPTLPFGTVVTITNVATGATTTCTVDDREEAGYPRVLDLSPSGFAQLAQPSQGVVDVSISW
jgi:rare lipoprotein A